MMVLFLTGLHLNLIRQLFYQPTLCYWCVISSCWPKRYIHAYM